MHSPARRLQCNIRNGTALLPGEARELKGFSACLEKGVEVVLGRPDGVIGLVRHLLGDAFEMIADGYTTSEDFGKLFRSGFKVLLCASLMPLLARSVLDASIAYCIKYKVLCLNLNLWDRLLDLFGLEAEPCCIVSSPNWSGNLSHRFRSGQRALNLMENASEELSTERASKGIRLAHNMTLKQLGKSLPKLSEVVNKSATISKASPSR
jgi:hypothetical protein